MIKKNISGKLCPKCHKFGIDHNTGICYYCDFIIINERYTRGHVGFMELLEDDWDELIIDDPELEYIEDEIIVKNCIHQRIYKNDIRCSLDWNLCNQSNCKNYRKTDRSIKNIGD